MPAATPEGTPGTVAAKPVARLAAPTPGGWGIAASVVAGMVVAVIAIWLIETMYVNHRGTQWAMLALPAATALLLGTATWRPGAAPNATLRVLQYGATPAATVLLAYGAGLAGTDPRSIAAVVAVLAVMGWRAWTLRDARFHQALLIPAITWTGAWLMLVNLEGAAVGPKGLDLQVALAATVLLPASWFTFAKALQSDGAWTGGTIIAAAGVMAFFPLALTFSQAGFFALFLLMVFGVFLAGLAFRRPAAITAGALLIATIPLAIMSLMASAFGF